MKVLFVAGMQHSGSTLTDHLISQHPGVVGLGEVAAFFSRKHMVTSAERWKGLAEAGRCSCGNPWSECTFWGPLMPHCGLNSEAPRLDKYRALFDHVRATLGDDAVVVDSSKMVGVLETLVTHREALGLGPDDLRVVLTIKDVRCFAMSIANKDGAARSVLAKIRHFNWWLGNHRRLLDFLERSGVPYRINLYERMCGDPESFAGATFDWLGLPRAGAVELGHAQSHIAMGNKDFLLRNRQRVSYDFRWYLDDAINAIYALHWRARAFNKRLYQLTAPVPAADARKA